MIQVVCNRTYAQQMHFNQFGNLKFTKSYLIRNFRDICQKRSRFIFRNGSLIVVHAVVLEKDPFLTRTLSKAVVDILSDDTLQIFNEPIHVTNAYIGDKESKLYT